MYLLGKALVFLLIGFAYSQQNPSELVKAQLESQVAGIVQEMEEKCRIANQTSIANSLESEAANAMKCVLDIVSPEHLIQRIGMAQRTGTVSSVINEMCKLWPQVHQCINEVIRDVKKCLNKKERDALDFNMSILDDTNTFFCENNADRTIRFIESNGAMCLQSASQEINTCTAHIAKNNKQNMDNKLLVTYDEEDCSNFHKARDCVRDGMSNCPSSEPSEIADEYMALIQRKVCNSATMITSFSTFNILLLLFLFVYTKMF